MSAFWEVEGWCRTAGMGALSCLRALVPSIPIAADSYPITARQFSRSSSVDIYRLLLAEHMGGPQCQSAKLRLSGELSNGSN